MIEEIKLERLKGLREDKDLRQEDIANYLNITQSAYSYYEIGKRQIPSDVLIKLATYYNTSVDYILGLSNTKKYDNMLKLTKIDYKYVGNNLKRIRKEKGLKQNEVAKMLCTNQPTWSRYESGKTLIVTDKLFDFARKFNVSIDRIIGKII